MNKKLIKSRSSRMDTLEAMACGCGCGCNDRCANCSGGGSFYVQRKNYYGGGTPTAEAKVAARDKASATR